MQMPTPRTCLASLAAVLTLGPLFCSQATAVRKRSDRDINAIGHRNIIRAPIPSCSRRVIRQLWQRLVAQVNQGLEEKLTELFNQADEKRIF